METTKKVEYQSNKALSKKDRMYQRIQKHGENLNRIFNTGIDPIALCKKLRRLEVKAERIAVHYCNGTGGIDSENWDDHCKPILEAVEKLLHAENADVRIFLNGDARGYALKIEWDDTDARRHDLYSDWGGYGILAPEFNGE